MSKIGTGLQESTKKLARDFLADNPVGAVVIIDDFAATLPDAHPYFYAAPSSRADKRGDKHRATLTRRNELVSSLKRGGPANVVPFTLRRVAKGTYEVITPGTGITKSRTYSNVRNFAATKMKELTRLFLAQDKTKVDPIEWLRIESMYEQVQELVPQIEFAERRAQIKMASLEERIKRAVSSEAYILGNPEAGVHSAYRKPVQKLAAPTADPTA